MTWSINDKQVLVTGGTSGIGRATATELARQGAHVTMELTRFGGHGFL